MNKKSIPYGISDLKDVLEDYYYIDKTKFIPLVEQTGSFLYLIRPRRFGKSLFLNMLDFYYNVKYKDEFELFKDHWIYNNHTPLKNGFHILKFDFSMVSTIGNIDDNFSLHCNIQVKDLIDTYKFDFTIDFKAPAHININQLMS